MLQSANDAVEAYWAERLGCPIGDLRRPTVTVVAHAPAFEGYRGVHVLRAPEGGVIVSSPLERVTALQEVCGGRRAERVFAAPFLARLLAPGVSAIIGPASIAYADRSTFVAAPVRAGVRRMTANEGAALAELRSACDVDDWQHSGVQPEHDPIFACFDGGRVIAAASWEARGPIRHIGVITHPAHRGRGFATVLGSEITAAALAEEAIPQWQTLISNTASLAIGRTLGFIERYQSIAVRLK
jgi:GNAT superfamily N-acetyltransferase